MLPPPTVADWLVEDIEAKLAEFPELNGRRAHEL